MLPTEWGTGNSGSGPGVGGSVGSRKWETRVGQEDARASASRGLRRAPLKNAAGALRRTEEKDVHPELMCEGEFGASRLLLGIGDRKRENKK